MKKVRHMSTDQVLISIAGHVMDRGGPNYVKGLPVKMHTRAEDIEVDGKSYYCRAIASRGKGKQRGAQYVKVSILNFATEETIEFERTRCEKGSVVTKVSRDKYMHLLHAFRSALAFKENKQVSPKEWSEKKKEAGDDVNKLREAVRAILDKRQEE